MRHWSETASERYISWCERAGRPVTSRRVCVLGKLKVLEPSFSVEDVISVDDGVGVRIAAVYLVLNEMCQAGVLNPSRDQTGLISSYQFVDDGGEDKSEGTGVFDGP